ncbi:hypothetical protein ACQEVF_25365 [Nonomuraea polychroma]|uniref:hypothetical protein n=1 Tax=Nonomuraea polychroma TaxID=46176 RepID=UPI003D8CBC43
MRARTVKLTWADGELQGLEIRALRVSIEQFFDLAPLIDGKYDIFDPADREALRELLMKFGKVLQSWNLEDEAEDGTSTPVPCTPEEFIRLDPAFVREVIDQWAEALSGVAAPLEQPSPDGEPFPEGSLPMEVLSPSPTS